MMQHLLQTTEMQHDHGSCNTARSTAVRAPGGSTAAADSVIPCVVQNSAEQAHGLTVTLHATCRCWHIAMQQIWCGLCALCIHYEQTRLYLQCAIAIPCVPEVQ